MSNIVSIAGLDGKEETVLVVLDRVKFIHVRKTGAATAWLTILVGEHDVDLRTKTASVMLREP